VDSADRLPLGRAPPGKDSTAGQDGALVHAAMVWRTRLDVKWCPGPGGVVRTRKVLPAHPGSYGTGVKRGLKNTTTSQSR
jgi:hypothetical protein